MAILVTVGIGSSLWVAIPAYRRHRAITQIESVGGRVRVREIGLDRVRNYVGPAVARAFGMVYSIALVDDHVTDDDLKNLAQFTELERLYLSGSAISDDGLRELRSLKKLEFLRLYQTRISNAGLPHLKGLESLKWLDLGGTDVTDDGLAELAGLRNLDFLDLSRTRVTGSGLKHLQKLPNLDSVNLQKDPVSDDNIRHIVRLPNLTSIYLGRTSLTAKGFAELHQSCPNLGILLSDGGCVGLHPGEESLDDPDVPSDVDSPNDSSDREQLILDAIHQFRIWDE